MNGADVTDCLFHSSGQGHRTTYPTHFTDLLTHNGHSFYRLAASHETRPGQTLKIRSNFVLHFILLSATQFACPERYDVRIVCINFLETGYHCNFIGWLFHRLFNNALSTVQKLLGTNFSETNKNVTLDLLSKYKHLWCTNARFCIIFMYWFMVAGLAL